MRRAQGLIEHQQSTIAERNHTLEMLSSQRLTAQENEKKKIAGDLHEGIAQDLGGIKMQVENAVRLMHENTPSQGSESFDPIVRMIQNAIQELRTIAMSLRPPSLDDFGIVAAIGSLCREFQSIYRNIHIEKSIKVREEEVPAALRIVIYRILQEALKDIATHGQANRVHIELARRENHIRLSIECRRSASCPSGAENATAGKTELATMREWTVLSGGSFSVNGNHDGGTTHLASWPARA